MRESLRKFIRESLLVELDQNVPPDSGMPDVSFNPNDPESVKSDPNYPTLVESYKYINENFSRFSADAQRILDAFGGSGSYITRYDLLHITNGLIVTLEQDLSDIKSTKYPVRAALFLMGAMNGTSMTDEQLKDVMLGYLDEIASLGGLVQVVKERKDRQTLTETTAGGEFLTRLAQIGRAGGRAAAATPGAAWSAAKATVDYFSPTVSKFVDSRIARGLKTFADSHPTLSAEELAEVVTHLKKESAEAVSGGAQALPGDIVGLTPSRSKLDKDMLQDLASKIFNATKAAGGLKGTAGRALWTITWTNLLSVLSGFVWFELFPNNAKFDEEATTALVMTYSIRQKVAEARSQLITALKDVTLYSVGGAGADPTVKPAEIVKVLEGFATTCMPGPRSNPMFVTTELINQGVASLKAIKA